ncbi:uncharacterized protein MYCFIDRAFT_179743 [Pseudocercospora fijiensis CIRAD86]|uniref:Uncharacterized protein n=1 Tax=Pseudocercospora fijiensis (strain CIRAD86) TaxID=383855 RepID=M2YIA1_PSEFD|nr:uncharacterized protein MYCFIDRAFT_179743 [Pseudocercospora fijiensis CIRAD86]EME77500.1 hypothetical protein MYCFIDRAFT_179743 [Pseudocercospora fijiensis CIRAD86]
MIAYLDAILGAAFLYLVRHRPSYAVWIARYFALRFGWYTLICLMISEMYQYFRRSNLPKAFGSVCIWFLGLTIVTTMQFLLLRLGDQLVITRHCGAYDANNLDLHRIVAGRMFPVTEGMALHLNPMGRQLNASYCNIELVRQTLYSSKTISKMETEQNVYETRPELQRSMHKRCNARAAATTASTRQKNPADSKGYDLTSLALSITEAQWVLVQSGGPLSTSRKVGLTNINLFAALNSLPTNPTFWDDARRLPSPLSGKNTNQFTLSYIYQALFRPILSRELYPYSLRLLEFIMTKFLSNPEYPRARTSFHEFLKATQEHADAVEWAHNRRCVCDDASVVSGPTECDLDHDLGNYLRRWISHFSTTTNTIEVDRAPIEKILELRRGKHPCEAWREAKGLLSEASQRQTAEEKQSEKEKKPIMDSEDDEYKIWQSSHCGTLGPLGGTGRKVPDMWMGWWDLLGTRREVEVVGKQLCPAVLVGKGLSFRDNVGVLHHFRTALTSTSVALRKTIGVATLETEVCWDLDALAQTLGRRGNYVWGAYELDESEGAIPPAASIINCTVAFCNPI